MYVAVALEKIVPYDVLVPRDDTNAQESKSQDPG